MAISICLGYIYCENIRELVRLIGSNKLIYEEQSYFLPEEQSLFNKIYIIHSFQSLHVQKSWEKKKLL